MLTQSAYPPLLSASVAVAWKITGVHTARLGVTMVAVLDACALAAAALAVVQAGRTAAARVARAWVPLLTGIAVAGLLVVVAAGITEPFLTNGYADPLWSLAAVGAVAFGLQLRSDPSTRAAAVILVLVAGMTKNEGFVTAVALVVLVAARSIGLDGLRGARDRLVTPLVAGGVRACRPGVVARPDEGHPRPGCDVHVLGLPGPGQPDGRRRPRLQSLPPRAGPGAAPGGARRHRAAGRAAPGGGGQRPVGVAGPGTGLVAVASALVTGHGAIGPWLLSTAHRITEYPALEGWWIVGLWAVVAVAGLAAPTATATRGAVDDPTDAVEDDPTITAEDDPATAAEDADATGVVGLVGAER